MSVDGARSSHSRIAAIHGGRLLAGGQPSFDQKELEPLRKRACEKVRKEVCCDVVRRADA
jgi:hypothetical protein